MKKLWNMCIILKKGKEQKWQERHKSKMFVTKNNTNNKISLNGHSKPKHRPTLACLPNAMVPRVTCLICTGQFDPPCNRGVSKLLSAHLLSDKLSATYEVTTASHHLGDFPQTLPFAWKEMLQGDFISFCISMRAFHNSPIWLKHNFSHREGVDGSLWRLKEPLVLPQKAQRNWRWDNKDTKSDSGRVREESPWTEGMNEVIGGTRHMCSLIWAA